MTLRITDTKTGKVYQTDNIRQSDNIEGLSQLCLDAGLNNNLVYCDIECLLKDGETWYMLDECGNWAYLPSHYRVTVLQ